VAESGLVTEFGAQALPSLESPAWESIGQRWPVADDDPAWLYSGFQAWAWSAHGVGLPSDHDELPEYVEESQDYQASLIAFAVDQFRKRKFETCWGAFVYQLVDPFPGIGFGMIDGAGRPRAALEALRQAMAPLRLILDPSGHTPLDPFGIGFELGRRACFRVITVNDDPSVTGPATVRWSVRREWAPDRTGMSRLVDAVRRTSFSGGLELELPTAWEPAVQVANLNLPLDAPGGYRLEAELLVGGSRVARSETVFEIGSALEPSRRTRLIPRYYADRLGEPGSLRRDPAGLRFTLLNQARPAVLSELGAFRLDGAPLRGAQALVESGAGLVPPPARLELPVGRRLELVVEMGEPLAPGRHELEMEIRVPGIAEGRLKIGGVVGPEELRPSS
jgi:hypothetical protein